MDISVTPFEIGRLETCRFYTGREFDSPLTQMFGGEFRGMSTSLRMSKVMGAVFRRGAMNTTSEILQSVTKTTTMASMTTTT